jgi:ATP-dependent DNA helicase DinG
VKKLSALIADKDKRLFRKLEKIIKNAETTDSSRKCSLTPDRDIERHLVRLDEFITLLSELIDKAEVFPESEAQYWETKRIIKYVQRDISEFADYNNNQYWLEHENSEITLHMLPKDIGLRLYTDQWSNGIPTIFTSGTLSINGDFRHIKKALGLEPLKNRLFETRKQSPFNLRENALLYISENTPLPDQISSAYIEAITDEIEALINAAYGHAAVVFTSYTVLEKVYAQVKTRHFAFPIFRLEKGSSNAINDFKQSNGGVLFASGSMYEGIDIPGDALSLLIVVKLPFAAPDPIMQYEESLYPNFSSYFDDVIMPEMLIKSLQLFGRVFRSEKDTGMVAFIDSRVNKKGMYRGQFLKAMPPCWLTDKISEVEDFIADKKPDEYFH